MADVKTELSCIRCNATLAYMGTKNFHEGSMLAEAFFGAWAENSVVMDVYFCRTCGHVEFFMDGIGEALRGKS